MRIVLVVTLAFVLAQAGCAIGDGHQARRTNVITRDSLAGFHLGDSRSAAESILGNGLALEHQAHTFRYAAGLTISYRTAPDGKPKVAWVSTTSSRYHTHSGVRVGSDQAAVEALGHMNCGPTTTTRANCQTEAHGPGLSLDLVNGRVTRIWLVERTN
ncbi:MAG: hypothetical protein ACRD3Q_17070 [Terriglobales bacterium]